MTRLGLDETPFASRRTPFPFSVDAGWDDPADSKAVIAWSRDFLARMERHAREGMYVNFSGSGEKGESLLLPHMDPITPGWPG